MKRVVAEEQGMTLLEIIVVLAVIGALAGLLGPVAFTYIEDANVRRAQSDTSRLAVAINKLYTDTGRWPLYADGDGPAAYVAGTDAGVLTSNAVCDGSDCTDATLPDDNTAGDLWAFGSSKLENISNQILTNTPFGSADANKDYTTTGSRAWRGPYVDRAATTDPWNRSYVVSIRNADPGIAYTAQKWVIVASGGPNGALETSPEALMTSNPVAAGDDIIARVR